MSMGNDFYMEDFVDDYNEKIILLVKQLSLECPMKDPLHSCPLSEFRKLPLKERFEFIDKLPHEQLDVLVQHHYDCFDERS